MLNRICRTVKHRRVGRITVQGTGMYLRQDATCHNATGTMFLTITPLDPGSIFSNARNPVLVQSFTHSSRALAFQRKLSPRERLYDGVKPSEAFLGGSSASFGISAVVLAVGGVAACGDRNAACRKVRRIDVEILEFVQRPTAVRIPLENREEPLALLFLLFRFLVRRHPVSPFRLIAYNFRSYAATCQPETGLHLAGSPEIHAFHTDAPCSLDGPPSIRQNIRTPAIQTGRRRIELRTGAFAGVWSPVPGTCIASAMLSTLHTDYEIFGSGIIRFSVGLTAQ